MIGRSLASLFSHPSPSCSSPSALATILTRSYHGLKYVRPARGMPSNLGMDMSSRMKGLRSIPMTVERVMREYKDVIESLTLRPGMTNPFHSNPDYEPWYGMLNEKTKDEMFDLHRKDPEFWTVRKLASEYDTEMVRVEAILILKEMERKMVENGFVVDQNKTAAQEELCGYPPYATREEYWAWKKSGEPTPPVTKPWGEIAQKIKPLFQFVPENEGAHEKGLFKDPEPLGQRYDTPLKNVVGKTIRNDSKEAGKRARFVFLETGNRKKGEVYIREKTGELRTGSSIEKEEEQRKFGVWRDKNRAFYIKQY